MAANLTGLEKETVIIFNEAEQFAEVFTYAARFKRRLASLATERPSDCRKTRETPEGAIEYQIPKSWLRINPTRNMSEEEKAQRAAVFERVRANKTSEASEANT